MRKRGASPGNLPSRGYREAILTMTEVIMPKMGDGMEEGTLLEWLKKDGDKVKSGEIIGSIQTDKATLELEAPGTGTLTGILLEEGGTVPVGKAIAAILKDGESLPDGWGGKSVTPGSGETLKNDAAPQGGAPASAPIELQQEATSPTTSEAASTEFGISADQPTGNGKPTEAQAQDAKADDAHESGNVVSEGRVKASPLARKTAAEMGVDLSGVSGTGPGGRIVQKDVQSANVAPKAAPAKAPVAASPAVVAGQEDETIKLPKLRQITAKRTTESKQQVPHFYVTVEVDVEKILTLRQMFEDEESGKVSINDFVVKACALALRDMPEVNSVFNGDTLIKKGHVNVGIAVALEDGLTVPVVKDADTMSLRAINAKVRELAKKARDGKASLDDLTGSTFAISNMGMLDVDNFLAIVNMPNAAILAIASVRKKAVVLEDDSIVARSRMNITCSCDHRVLDGAVGARFINVVKTYLENPTRLIS
ncbi:2-oxo acid dehydrogenase subunit E2 [bacterium]|nr:MAG: 2-oxo acid dehydrogenase subunit E2 [bacterium]